MHACLSLTDDRGCMVVTAELCIGNIQLKCTLFVVSDNVFQTMLCSALQLSNDSRFSHSTGSGSGIPTAKSDSLTTLTGTRRRQETQLHLDLDEAGSIIVGSQQHSDVLDQVVEAVPDGDDSECVVELRACSFCWISLTAIISRFEEAKTASAEVVQYAMTANNNSESQTVTCRLWYATIHRVGCGYVIISTISMVIALRSHVVGPESIVVT